MTDLDIIYGAGFVDDDIVTEALDYRPKRFSFAPVVCVAAAAALAVTVGLTWYLRSDKPSVITPNSNDTLPSSAYTDAPSDTDVSSVDKYESVHINDEAVWGMGKTFDEITARYGEVTGGSGGVCTFERGYGRYVWNITAGGESREEEIEAIRESGGCIAIGEITAREFLSGDISVLTLDNFASECGFETVPLNPVPEGGGLYDDRRFAYYTHPSYENMTFIMNYKTSGFDAEAVFTIRYDDDEYDDQSGTNTSDADELEVVHINDEAVWGIGKTFDEITARYGEVTGGSGGVCVFAAGYGRYSWAISGLADGESREEEIEAIRESGGCIAIGEITAREFLNGDISVLTLDNFASECGFEVVPLNPVPEGGGLYDDRRFAYYTHPSYENMTFIMNYKTSGFDEETVFSIQYDDAEEKTYAELFEDFCPENPTTYGPPMTFDEVMETMLPKAEYPEYNVESLCLVEVVRALTNEEYSQMNGYGSNGYEDEATVYEIKIVEDLISGDKPDETAEPLYVKLTSGSGVRLQHRQDPTYAPGEKFTVALTKQCDGYDFRFSVADHALRFDLPDDEELTTDDETTMLYYRSISNRPDTKIFDFAEDIDVTAIASTPQNPLNYTQKVDMETLVNTLREDWRERGISVHYE